MKNSTTKCYLILLIMLVIFSSLAKNQNTIRISGNDDIPRIFTNPKLIITKL